ncbi:MAG: universal stress protein, partial [Anaerolineae bacterium]|nr:universal stress protein [Anaerolineae bacterium]
MNKTSSRGANKHSNPLSYAHVVVVTLAKPETAPHMLELAVSLADPEDGRVVALTIAEGEGEDTEQRVNELQPIVDRFAEEGHPVELVTQIAGSVARGILDGAREHQAETLIIGVQQSGRRQVKLGSLVENIVAAAPCNVLIYRPSESPEYDSVVVPIDSSHESLISLRFGAALAAKKHIPLLPLYIQRDYTYRPEHEEQVRKILEPLPDDLVRKDMISGRDPAERILRDRDDDDLLIVGFSQKSNLELEFGRDLASTLLNRAPGPVLLSSQILRERDTFLGAVQRWLQRFDPTLTQTERNEIVWASRRSALNNIDYSVLIMMSAALASLGLLLNSAAVIIGAMLVAPLMSPLGALATGMATGLTAITRRAALTLLQGVGLALLISVFIGLVLPT